MGEGQISKIIYGLTGGDIGWLHITLIIRVGEDKELEDCERVPTRNGPQLAAAFERAVRQANKGGKFPAEIIFTEHGMHNVSSKYDKGGPHTRFQGQRGREYISTGTTLVAQYGTQVPSEIAFCIR